MFYYYKGIKQNIGINTQKALLLSKNEPPVALSITNTLKNRYGMDSITSVDANYQEVHFLELNTKVIYLQSLDKNTAQLPSNAILNNVFSGVYSAKDIGNQYKENHKTIVL